MELRRIGQLPEVKSVVLSDRAGVLLEAVREDEAEGVAAVAGFLVATLVEAGDELGLGVLRRVAFRSAGRAAVVEVLGEQLATARVEPPAALAAVERSLDNLAGGQ